MLPRYWAKSRDLPLVADSGRHLRAVVARPAPLCVLAFTAVLFLGYLVHRAQDGSRYHFTVPEVVLPAEPPLYSRFHRALLRLPQHHWENERSRPDEKFFFVAGHSRHEGWGHAMQELLLNSYLAYKAGRSFVLANYTWNDDGSLYSNINGTVVPSQIPYSAMIRGPSAGDPFPAGAHAPPAVSREYFEKMCQRKMTVSRENVQGGLSELLNAQTITNAWLARLSGIDEPCVQSGRGESGQLYDSSVFGDRYALRDIWSSLARSPILTHFGWSPLVELAFDTNLPYFSSPRMLEPYLSNRPFTTNAERYARISGLMAIHVRRGDYEKRCQDIADEGSTYLAMNSFPELPDQFVPPARGEGVDEPTHVREIVRPHCYPSVQEVVDRVRSVRRSPAAAGLKKLYIMSDGDREYLHQLALALNRDTHWETIATTRDLVLNAEQMFVSHAVDMLVGQRAQVFVGNGFSTVTSNVVTMRLANRFRYDSIRFW